jgi:MFS family permease
MILGEILSSALLYINTSLTLLTDISADESTLLIALYSSLFSLGSIFAPFEPHQFCAEWLRSHYIRELLEWRMVDIMDSWRAGLLQGVFPPEEMIGWLKKLFQASDMRAKNIAELQREIVF